MKLRTKMTTIFIDEEEEAYSSINPPQDGTRILRLLSSALERRISRPKIVTMMENVKSCDVMTVFDGSEVPGLSIHQYLERMYKYCNCTNSSCFTLAYVYMDRFLSKTGTRLTYLNVHRLLITAVMLAAKFLSTQSDNNVHFGKVGGISTAEMNGLEIEFLFCVDFRLHVSPDLFRKYCAKLEEANMKTIYPIGAVHTEI